jgi:hypothetical protein
MMHLKNNNNNKRKNNNAIVRAAALFIVATLVVFAAGSSAVNTAVATTVDTDGQQIVVIAERYAPVVVSGDNIYIAWWTNKTANNNEEVMFRASTDAGQTFTDKINLSNTTEADSVRVEIAGEGDNVIVSWWEHNQTGYTPVARISNDAGQTFGPLLRLATNGTIGSTEEGGETVEEEAVGGADVAE